MVPPPARWHSARWVDIRGRLSPLKRCPPCVMPSSPQCRFCSSWHWLPALQSPRTMAAAMTVTGIMVATATSGAIVATTATVAMTTMIVANTATATITGVMATTAITTRQRRGWCTGLSTGRLTIQAMARRAGPGVLATTETAMARPTWSTTTADTGCAPRRAAITGAAAMQGTTCWSPWPPASSPTSFCVIDRFAQPAKGKTRPKARFFVGLRAGGYNRQPTPCWSSDVSAQRSH